MHCQHTLTWLLAGILLMLTACGGGIQPGIDDQRRWQLSGKIGLRAPNLAESAYLNWRQCGDRYSIRLSGPLGQTAARIEGRGEQLTVRIEDRDPVTTTEPERLLQEQLGWSIPLHALRYWVRAEAAPGGNARFEGPAGRPETLQQFGWELRYLDYHQNDQLALPAKLILRNPQLQATLLIREWQLGDAVTDCQT